MATTVTNQIRGITVAESVKAPVLAVYSTNITLSGLQGNTAGDRILVYGQTDATENGIYEASSSTWQRAPDFDGNDDVVQGTLVLTADADLSYRVTTADPIVIGTSSISFESVAFGITTQNDFNAYLALSDPFKRTADEISAGKTPTNYAIQPQNAMPLRLNGVGNGVTNDTTAIADTKATNVYKYIDLGGKTYLVTAVPTGIQLFNGTLDMTGSSDDNYLNCMWGYKALANNVFTPYLYPSSTLDFAGGNYNTAIGAFAMFTNTDGRRNTAIGAEAMYSNTTGAYCVAIGGLAMRSNTTGSNNMAIGTQTMQDNTTGSENVAIGSGALLRNSTADHNVAIGHDSLANNTTGARGTAIGRQSLLENTTAADNTAIGFQAGSALTTGAQNTAIGSGALGASVTGARNVAIGYRALSANTASNNVAVGTDALILNTSGTANIAIGYSTLDACVTANNNTAIGDSALGANTASNNTAVGKDTLLANTSGNLNSGFGYSALSNLTTETNCAGLGYNSQITGSNQVQLGDSNTTTYAYGAVQNRSDARDKADIRNTVLGLSFIEQLRPVDFKWAYREDDGRVRSRYHHGLIAQEVKATCDGLGIDFGGYQDHLINGGKDVKSIGYSELIAPLIKAIQELSDRVKELERER